MWGKCEESPRPTLYAIQPMSTCSEGYTTRLKLPHWAERSDIYVHFHTTESLGGNDLFDIRTLPYSRTRRGLSWDVDFTSMFSNYGLFRRAVSFFDLHRLVLRIFTDNETVWFTLARFTPTPPLSESSWGPCCRNSRCAPSMFRCYVGPRPSKTQSDGRCSKSSWPAEHGMDTTADGVRGCSPMGWAIGSGPDGVSGPVCKLWQAPYRDSLSIWNFLPDSYLFIPYLTYIFLSEIYLTKIVLLEILPYQFSFFKC